MWWPPDSVNILNSGGISDCYTYIIIAGMSKLVCLTAEAYLRFCLGGRMTKVLVYRPVGGATPVNTLPGYSVAKYKLH